MTFFQDITPSDYLGNNNEPGVLAFEALEADRQLPLAVFFGDVMVLQFPLTAHGGDFGCAFTYQAPNEEYMLRVGGDSPPPSYVSADSDIEWTAYYEGIKASTQMDDLHAMVTYTDPVTGQTHQPCTDATVVEIRVSPSTEAPENNCSGRHKYGVCEVVNCLQTPSTPKVVWTATHGSFKESASYVDFICPLYATSNPLEATIGDVVFVPNISVVEPQGIIATNAVNINYGEHPNKAGYVGMQLQLYVRPMDVSFDEIAVEEVPSDQGEHFGHFTNTYFSSRWSHTRTNGAGDWIDVGSKAEGEEGEFPNRFGVDTAAYEGVLPCFRPDGMAIAQPDSTTSWSYGYMYWANPFGWNIKGTNGYTAPFREFATSTIDEFYILLDGTMSILKLQNTVTRMTNDCVYLNGVLQ